MKSDFPYDVGPRATVHWCPADASHRLQVIAGARRGPGWYVVVLDGCLGRIIGPFVTQAEAEEHSEEWRRTRAP